MWNVALQQSSAPAIMKMRNFQISLQIDPYAMHSVGSRDSTLIKENIIHKMKEVLNLIHLFKDS